MSGREYAVGLLVQHTFGLVDKLWVQRFILKARKN